MLNRLFKLDQAGTDVRTEVTAGLTTFMTMAYILAVNPTILSACGMDAGSVFGATAISACIATLAMALFANLPIALAPGMGINAFFAFTVVLTMKQSWQFALTAVFLEGLIFIVLTLCNVREAIIDSIPLPLKKAIAAGIGLFIAFIGLQGAGICVKSDATMVTMGNLSAPGTLLALIGLVIMSGLMVYKVRGALLIGILLTTLIGIPLGVSNVADFNAGALGALPDISKTFMQFDFSRIMTWDMLSVLLTLLFCDMFDTVGALVGVVTKGNMLDEKGNVPHAKGAFLADAIGTTVGAMFGTSTVTSFVESVAGVAEGGRTGLAALTTAGLFFLAIFMAPLFLLVPAQATAPALILVGLAMASSITEIDFSDYVYAIPAFLTIILMTLTYSISNGIYFCFIAYALMALLAGRGREVTPLAYIIAIIFVVRFALV